MSALMENRRNLNKGRFEGRASSSPEATLDFALKLAASAEVWNYVPNLALKRTSWAQKRCRRGWEWLRELLPPGCPSRKIRLQYHVSPRGGTLIRHAPWESTHEAPAEMMTTTAHQWI